LLFSSFVSCVVVTTIIVIGVLLLLATTTMYPKNALKCSICGEARQGNFSASQRKREHPRCKACIAQPQQVVQQQPQQVVQLQPQQVVQLQPQQVVQLQQLQQTQIAFDVSPYLRKIAELGMYLLIVISLHSSKE
jgi:hypothetical protein